MKHLLVVHWKRMDPVQFRAEGSMEEDNKFQPKILLVITGFRSDRIVHNLQSDFTDFAKISH